MANQARLSRTAGKPPPMLRPTSMVLSVLGFSRNFYHAGY